ncbi:MAG TPA: hypothetical protein VLW17_06380 [Thermoanaerobaculaceae bacterium]|nr:hypothetical protein [Thermoanaerobaculaceae bacterium]
MGRFGLLSWSVMVSVLAAAAVASGQAPTGDGGHWYFALSGDSRDCGDLIMPKIAHDIEANRAAAPVEFYWHLGDFRRSYDIDCDMLLVAHPGFDCRTPRKDPLGANDMADYLDRAWDDFLARQVAPFGSLQVFLGIGNHELMAGHDRADFRRAFRRWLTQEPLHAQRIADSGRGVPGDEGDTTYHFVRHGVDFIFLDNAGGEAFTAGQIVWLTRVLAADAADPQVRTIAVGMHAALPGSRVRGHAMDDTCQGRCSGRQVYEMLYDAQGLGGPPERRKHVYVFASHFHAFVPDAYDTPDHAGRVLPGWVVGTAGAQQYVDTIRYGYLLVEAMPDGTLAPRFREVTRGSPPLATGDGAANLTEFCFAYNKREFHPHVDSGPPCACGAARE